MSSSDGGRRWEPVSLYGRADFHPLRRADARIYGFDFRQLKFLVTTDEGRTWKPLELPAPMYDFVVDPADPDRLAASTPAGLLESVDGGHRWLPAGKGGDDLRLAWPQAGRFYAAAKDGTVTTSDGPGSRGAPVGELPAKPQTLMLSTQTRCWLLWTAGGSSDPTTADSPGATGCSSGNLDLVIGNWESRSDGNQGVAHAKVPNRGLVFDGRRQGRSECWREQQT